VRVAWRATPRRARRGSRPLLVAAGGRRFARARSASVRVRLTHGGRRLLAHTDRARLTGVASFTAVGAKPVTASATFVLRR
jgi:hypothetical protein